MVPRKVIEDLEGAGVWGGLAPIIEVRISGPPGSGTLRGVDTVIWRLSGRYGISLDDVEMEEAPKSHRGRKGRRGLGRLSPNNKEAG